MLFVRRYMLKATTGSNVRHFTDGHSGRHRRNQSDVRGALLPLVGLIRYLQPKSAIEWQVRALYALSASNRGPSVCIEAKYSGSYRHV